jgi:poly(A) polymerase
LARFFQFYRDYDWRADNPITLVEIQNNSDRVTWEIDPSLLYVEDPKAQMPIITPAFPSMNSTYNISASTKHVILTELEKAAMITNELIVNKGSS